MTKPLAPEAFLKQRLDLDRPWEGQNSRLSNAYVDRLLASGDAELLRGEVAR